MKTRPASDYLADARRKVDRAKHHVRNLKAQVDAFWKTLPYDLLRDQDHKTGETVYRIRYTASFPDEWGPHVGDIVYSLRSALEVLAQGMIVAGGGTLTNRTGFPISVSRQKFESTGLRKYREPPTGRCASFGLYDHTRAGTNLSGGSTGSLTLTNTISSHRYGPPTGEDCHEHHDGRPLG